METALYQRLKADVLYLWLMRKAFWQLHAAVLFAGFTAILGKLIKLNEVLLVSYRLLLTVILLALIITFKSQWKKRSGAEMLKITGVGFIICLHWVAFYGSIKYSNVSVALVCFSATGFFTALLEPMITGKKPVWQEIMLGFLAIAGIYIIFDFYPEYVKGIIFGIVAALGSAVFPILNKQLLKKHSPRTLTFYELAGGFVLLLLVIPAYLHFFPAEYLLPTAHDWFWLFLLASACTVVMFELQLHALKKISAFTVNLTYNLEPVYGILLAFVIFDESKMLGRGFYLGLSLIILAIVLQMVRAGRGHSS